MYTVQCTAYLNFAVVEEEQETVCANHWATITIPIKLPPHMQSTVK